MLPAIRIEFSRIATTGLETVAAKIVAVGAYSHCS